MQTIVKVLEKAVITSALLTSVAAIADEAEEGQVQSGTIEEVIVQGHPVCSSVLVRAAALA